ncbi:MAG: hypothetical protein OXF56_00180 [Rhodobacteraceae bacterium]|nr:hypothetical protein [Paracoccaceae bacterium]
MHTPGPDIRFPHRAARDPSPKRVRDTSHDLRIAGNTVVCKKREDGKGSAGKPDLVGEIQHHGVFVTPTPPIWHELNRIIA